MGVIVTDIQFALQESPYLILQYLKFVASTNCNERKR